jgi:inhibitor of KinA sporulation pathway (predicted exonuclease)
MEFSKNIKIGEFQSFVKPKINPILTDFCKNLTHIKQEDVDSAETFPNVNDKFNEWLGMDYHVFSWGDYDKKQYEKDCTLHKQPFIWKYNHTNLKTRFASRYKIKPGGVGTALRTLGSPFDGTPHRAIDDARNIAIIFLNMKK